MKPTVTSLTALALLLSGGLPLTASAQKAPHDLSQHSVVAALDEGSSRVQRVRTETEEVITETTEDSAVPPSSSTDGQGWLPPGGSIQVKTTDQGIRYTSGGVGESEREELRSIADRFNLRIMSAMQGGGEYLADLRVQISDANGNVVLSDTTKGPYFLAQIPPGTYTVSVSGRDQTQQQTIKIDGPRQTRLDLYWR